VTSELSNLIISSVLVADMTPQLMLLPVAIGTKKQRASSDAKIGVHLALLRATGECWKNSV
jgi:hypothetical protein